MRTYVVRPRTFWRHRSERTERSVMEDKLRTQREQIAELAKSNAHILDELKQLKTHLHPGRGAGNPLGGDPERQRR